MSGGIIDGTPASEDNLVNPVSAALHEPVDSKAMRKFGGDMVIYAALQVLEVGTATLRWFYNSRSLVKLP